MHLSTREESRDKELEENEEKVEEENLEREDDPTEWTYGDESVSLVVRRLMYTLQKDIDA